MTPDSSHSVPPAIEVTNLSKTYRSGKEGDVVAIGDVSFSVKEGEFVTIVGRSGCGKSTLLKIVAGLLGSTSGSVRVFGSEVTSPLKSVGFVFQNPCLLRWRNTLDNILLPAELIGEDRKSYLQRAKELVSTVGLDGFEGSLPRVLSMGMQQRAAIARALLLDPPILLMDEPFGSLDELTREEMTSELLRVTEGFHKTVLFVTHNIDEAVLMGDRVLVLSHRPSTVKLDLEVAIPRPRPEGIRATEEYRLYSEQVRSILGIGRPHVGDPTPAR